MAPTHVRRSAADPRGWDAAATMVWFMAGTPGGDTPATADGAATVAAVAGRADAPVAVAVPAPLPVPETMPASVPTGASSVDVVVVAAPATAAVTATASGVRGPESVFTGLQPQPPSATSGSREIRARRSARPPGRPPLQSVHGQSLPRTRPSSSDAALLAHGDPPSEPTSPQPQPRGSAAAGSGQPADTPSGAAESDERS